jgi:hypothetical protein
MKVGVLFSEKLSYKERYHQRTTFFIKGKPKINQIKSII